MTKEGTIRLLAAIYRRALQEREYLGERASWGGIYRKNYESAMYYLDVEFPAIKEALNESFKEL